MSSTGRLPVVREEKVSSTGRLSPVVRELEVSSAVMNETLVAPLSAIPPGEGRNFSIAGKRLAIFHTRAGRVFATQAECPHKAGPLADGLVGGDTLICPLHSWKFNLTTGEPLLGDCKLKTYPARVDESGRVLVTIDD